MASWRTRRLTRRRVVRMAAGAVGMSAVAGMAGTARSGRAEVNRQGPLEQNTVKRRGTGLRGYDAERAFDGYTLFTPPGRVVYLIDMEGNVVHTWQAPYPVGRYGYLTPRGTLLYSGRTPGAGWLARQAFKAGALLELDWNGRVLWEVQHPGHHHDGIQLRNENLLFPAIAQVPDDIAERVQGGRPGTEDEGRIYASFLVEMTTAGRAVWEWRTWEHLDPDDTVIPGVQNERDRWATANGVAEWPNGDLTVSYPGVSTVITIERHTGQVIWKLGSPPVSFQHAPTPLPNGNLLIFDNGTTRLDASQPFSRVLEVDPTTSDIVWSYQDSPAINFFTSRSGNAQRLPNGNTLICESQFGRFFEVTADGEIVWEYVNPFFGGAPSAQTNNVFRVYRYSEEEIARARATGA